MARRSPPRGAAGRSRSRTASGTRRGKRDRVVVLPQEAQPALALHPDRAAVRAFALADHEARRAADLLRDLVRDLGQVVEIQAEVVGARAGLAAQRVLEHLQVLRLAHPGGLADGRPGAPEQSRDQLVPHRVEGSMLARRRHDGPPASGSPGLTKRDLRDAPLLLACLGLRSDGPEGEVLEDAQAHAVTGGPAVLAIALRRRQRAPRPA